MNLVNDSALPAVALPNLGPGDRAIVTIIIKGTFEIVPGSAAKPAAAMEPIAWSDQLVEDPRGLLPRLDSDLAPFKPCADVILLGRARTPGRKPAPHVDVRLRVGRNNKVLRVFGKREWKPGGLGREPKIGDPEPFRECELSWTESYGGNASPANPVGTGWIPENPKLRKKDIEGLPLPRIEDPENLIEVWEDRPQPAGFGTVGRGWEGRARHLGVHDEKWQKEHPASLPRDFSFEFHNSAPADQQVEGYLRGNESFAIVNATADGRLDGRLPGWQPVVTLQRRGAGTREEVPMRIDTAIFEPESLRLTLVWRGAPTIRAIDDLDITDVRIQMRYPS